MILLEMSFELVFRLERVFTIWTAELPRLLTLITRILQLIIHFFIIIFLRLTFDISILLSLYIQNVLCFSILLIENFPLGNPFLGRRCP